jgi:sodium transport system ATP-binding protein
MPGPLAVLDSASKSFGDVFAVVELSLSIPGGEIYGLLGPNGAGKTTALAHARWLARAQPRQRAGGGPRRQHHLRQTQLGYLSGSTGLFGRLTPARGARLFWPNPRAFPRRDWQARGGARARWPWTGILDRRCEALSTGERQRVSIARAVLHDPSVLILDEPTSGLDVLASRFMRDFIRAERARGKAVLFSTHYLAEAELLCDRIGFLHRGRLLVEGSPSEIRAQTGQSSLEEAFLALEEPRSPEARRETPRHVFLTFGKELREALRDRRTLAIMILLPLVVYPLLAMLAAQVATGREKQREERPSTIALAGKGPSRDALAAEMLKNPTIFVLLPSGLARRCRTRAPRPAGRARPARCDGKLTVIYDASRDESRAAEERLDGILAKSFPDGCAPRFSAHKRSVAPQARLGGYLLSKALPLFVVLMVLLGAFYPAIDVTAGERERGTLETVLCSPIRRFDLMLGKVLAVAALAALTGVLNLASMAITLMQILRLAAQNVVVDIPWGHAAAEQPGDLPRRPALRGGLRRTGCHRAHLQGSADPALARLLSHRGTRHGRRHRRIPTGRNRGVDPGHEHHLARPRPPGWPRDVVRGTLHPGLDPAALGGGTGGRRAHVRFRALVAPTPRRLRASGGAARTTKAGDALVLFALAFLLLYFVFLPIEQRHLPAVFWSRNGLVFSGWCGCSRACPARPSKARWDSRARVPAPCWARPWPDAAPGPPSPSSANGSCPCPSSCWKTCASRSFRLGRQPRLRRHLAAGGRHPGHL